MVGAGVLLQPAPSVVLILDDGSTHYGRLVHRFERYADGPLPVQLETLLAALRSELKNASRERRPWRSLADRDETAAWLADPGAYREHRSRIRSLPWEYRQRTWTEAASPCWSMCGREAISPDPGRAA